MKHISLIKFRSRHVQRTHYIQLVKQRIELGSKC